MKRGPKIICLRRKALAAIGCLAAAVLMCCPSAVALHGVIAERGSSCTDVLKTHETDILNSKKILEQQTGAAPESFSFE